MPPPSNLKHAHTFLQTSSWFRKFIPNFATIAKPLNDLLKENAAWEWRPEQQEAFETLKDRLTTAPILQQTERTRALTQSELPSSKGRRTNKNQSSTPADYSPLQNGTAYTITEREALAIVWAVNKFRGYIGENTSVVITDHQLLRWLMTLKSPTGRLARWALQLQPFNLTIRYIPGRTNVLADLLSRQQCDVNTKFTCPVCTVHVDIPIHGTPQPFFNEFVCKLEFFWQEWANLKRE
jgi:hypothetical protein